jgi:hypothetical protein
VLVHSKELTCFANWEGPECNNPKPTSSSLSQHLTLHNAQQSASGVSSALVTSPLHGETQITPTDGGNHALILGQPVQTASNSGRFRPAIPASRSRSEGWRSQSPHSPTCQPSAEAARCAKPRWQRSVTKSVTRVSGAK